MTRTRIANEWAPTAKPGDVIRAILSPEYAEEPAGSSISTEALAFLEALIGPADIAIVQCHGRRLILLPEDIFCRLSLAAGWHAQSPQTSNGGAMH